MTEMLGQVVHFQRIVGWRFQDSKEVYTQLATSEA